MDLRKEIKLSDLFKRRSKPAEEWEAKEPEAATPDSGGTRLKREIKLPFGRGRKAEKPAREPKAKGPKAPRRSLGRKGSPALPQVPLMRAFDLMPKEDSREAAAGRRPSPAQLVLAVLGLLVIAGLASYFLIANARVADKERKHDALRAELAAKNVPAQKPAPEGDAALVQERDQRQGAVGSALGSRIAWDRLLREFSLVLPEDVWLKSLTGTSGSSAPAAPADPAQAAASTSSFEINGYTRKQDGVALLLSRMSVLPELDSVQLVSATSVKLGNEDVVEFTIRANVKPRATGGTA
jgi:Tfp pilus assembly protein PilN